jgi:hypothetical protein
MKPEFSSSKTASINLGTLGGFLIGKRDAIVIVANSKLGLLLSFLFVVGAGVARNYDHHLLLREPLWILGPMVSPLVTSVLIFGVVKTVGKLEAASSFLDGNYLAFLRCYLMTAPLAWLYGIPVEQFAGELSSAIFNFSMLLLVSIWRVTLMVRVLQVLFHFGGLFAFGLIILPASAIMFFATFVSAMNIVGIMGGLRLDEADSFLLAATQSVTLSSLALFAVGVVVLIWKGRGRQRAERSWTVEYDKVGIAWSSWLLGALAIGVFAGLSVPHQKKLSNLKALHASIAEQNFELTEKIIFSRQREDFPQYRDLVPQKFVHDASRAGSLLVWKNEWPGWFRVDLIKALRSPLSSEENEPLSPWEKNRVGSFLEGLEDSPGSRELLEAIDPRLNYDEIFEDKEEGARD